MLNLFEKINIRKLLKYLLEHPELLERPANEEVDYDHH